MSEEMDSREAGGKFGRAKRKRKGIFSSALELLHLKQPEEDEEEEEVVNDYSFPKGRMQYENTKFGNGTQNGDKTPNAGIGDVGSWHAEDQMMIELQKRSKKKLRQMEREANKSSW